MQKKLTDTFVERLGASETVLRVWDTQVKGFGIRVTPSGHKSYVFQFTRGKSKVQATIGSAEAWSCEDAREKARDLRKLHEDGKDARAMVVEERKAGTLDELICCWREDYKPKIRPHSQACFESLLKRISPALGSRLVKDLALSDVEDLHRKISREGHVVTANRAATFLRRLLSIAEKKGWRPMGSNPVTHLERPTEDARTRVLTPEELEILGATLRSLAEGDLDTDPILFLLFSGLRKNEALALKWEQVDLERGTMTFQVHKTSKKTGAKVLPINSHLRDILSRRAATRLSSYVFPGYFKRVKKKGEDGSISESQAPSDGPQTSIKWVWSKAVRGAKLGKTIKNGRRTLFEADATVHDLRRTFNSVCAELGYPPQVFDTLLGHKLPGVAGVYTQLQASGGILAEASQATADWINAAMQGQKPHLGEKVVIKEETKQS